MATKNCQYQVFGFVGIVAPRHMVDRFFVVIDFLRCDGYQYIDGIKY